MNEHLTEYEYRVQFGSGQTMLFSVEAENIHEGFVVALHRALKFAGPEDGPNVIASLSFWRVVS